LANAGSANGPNVAPMAANIRTCAGTLETAISLFFMLMPGPLPVFLDHKDAGRLNRLANYVKAGYYIAR
jgi:hypothetical protein